MKTAQFILLPVYTWHNYPRGHWCDPKLINLATVRCFQRDANYSRCCYLDGSFDIIGLSVEEVNAKLEAQSPTP